MLPSAVGGCLLLLALPARADDNAFTPTKDYETRTLRGFSLLVHPELAEHPDEAAATFDELDAQLEKIEAVVPKRALNELRQARFWIEWASRPNGAAEFHVSADWLKENGYNPDKVLCVEINNCRNFVAWSQDAQPWMVLHELAHAYHHRVLKHDHPGLEAAYRAAVEKKLYDAVDYFRPGEKQKAYALTNVDEYFAELTEAYFGRNDFYPFNRSDLQRHDPAGFEVLAHIWNEGETLRRGAFPQPAVKRRSLAEPPSRGGVQKKADQ
jgi:hypothetical protein